MQQDPQEASTGRKRRVVGTIVLLALALIILPQLFDGEGSYQPQFESRIPERPIITLLPQPVQSRPVMAGDTPIPSVATTGEPSETRPRVIEFPQTEQTSSSGVSNTAPAASADAIRSEARPTLNSAGLPEGWVVQLGTFGDLANANKLLRDLLADEYKAFERRSQRGGAEMSTILVGPVIDRTEADRLLVELAAKLNLKPLVKRYEREVLR